MTKKLSIQRLFNIIVAVIIAVMAVVYLSFNLFVFSPAYERGNREVRNTVLSSRDSIEAQFKIMSNIASSLAYNTDVQKYLRLDSAYELFAMSEDISALGRLSCEGISAVRTVQLKDNTGRLRTVYGGSIDDSFYTPSPLLCKPDEFLMMKYTRTGTYTRCCYMRNIVSTLSDSSFGEILGQIYVVMDIYEIQSLLNQLELADDGFVAVIDRDNRVMLSSRGNIGEVIDATQGGYQVSSLSQTDFHLVMTDSISGSSVQNVRIISNLTLVMMVLLLGMILLIYWFFMRKFIAPVSRITDAMRRNTTFRERIDVETGSELDIIVDGINSMLDRLEQLTKRIVSNQQKLYEMELLNQKSSIMALQNQTNPHFLYNTLECIRSIALVYKCKEISTISVSLAKIFRYSVQGNSLVTFEEELAIVREYMKIINIRFPGKIDIEYNIDDETLKKPCYKMIMQPLVENSVRHGIEKIAGKGRLTIDVYCQKEDIFTRISDNGCGIEPDVLEDIVSRLDSENDVSEHIGLYNVNKRIELHYGKPYGLTIESAPGEGTTVTIRMPDTAD
ncbi:MAG: histidine kinase [Clostridia bacterium]|nr:histidine kinase [Clostridia bacterium]